MHQSLVPLFRSGASRLFPSECRPDFYDSNEWADTCSMDATSMLPTGSTRGFATYAVSHQPRDSVCPPSAVIGTPRTVTAPVGPLRGVGTRLSNLDRNGRLVKRGVTVSSHGLRFLVVKVSRGWAYGRYLNFRGQHPDGKTTTRLCCESVQVVA